MCDDSSFLRKQDLYQLHLYTYTIKVLGICVIAFNSTDYSFIMIRFIISIHSRDVNVDRSMHYRMQKLLYKPRALLFSLLLHLLRPGS